MDHPTHSAAALLVLDRGAGDLEGQVYRAIRERILLGRLQPGQSLPSTRALASSLGVARSTVVHAYDRLKAEGYLDASAGAASRVAAIATPVLAGGSPKAPADVPPEADPPFSLALAPGVPDLAAFPHVTWARLLGARARALRWHDLGYGAAAGIAELREALLAHISLTRGVVASAGQVIVLPSTKAAIWLLARLKLRLDRPGGSTVWIEDPGYATAQALLRAAGAELVPVPCDASGIDIRRATGHPPRLIYVTPSHQYPTGTTMSLARRLAVLEAARTHGALVLEDDYDSEFQFDGRPIASLQGIDQHGVVAYLGTMSKVLAPGLRVAYAVLPPSLVDAAQAAIRLQGLSVPIHVQAALADFLREGHLRAHVRRMTPVYAARMAACIAALHRHCAEALDVGAGAGGLQLAAWFREERLDDVAIARALRARGLAPQPLSSMHLGAGRPGLLLGIAGLAPSEAEGAAVMIRSVTEEGKEGLLF
jgi:GntR family transcriptional regulator/MocR family aminotransferase